MVIGKVTKKLKIGIIGVGHMGQYHVNVVTMLPHRFELMGVYDAQEERAAEVANKFETIAFDTIDDLLEHIQAVIIAVPTTLHHSIAKKALEKGIHVLLEKPITETVEQAEELIHIANKKGLIFQVGHVERFNGAVQEVNKIITNPLLVECRRMNPFTPRIKDVGVVLDLMIHDLDIVVNLINSPIRKITALGNRIFSEKHEDVADVQIQFDSGCIATFAASRATQSKVRTLSIIQEKSYILLNYADQDIHIHRQASSANLITREEIRYSQESFIEQLYVHKDNPLKLEHVHFYECITQGVTPIVSGEMDVNILKITHEVLRQINNANVQRIMPAN